MSALGVGLNRRRKRTLRCHVQAYRPPSNYQRQSDGGIECIDEKCLPGKSTGNAVTQQ